MCIVIFGFLIVWLRHKFSNEPWFSYQAVPLHDQKRQNKNSNVSSLNTDFQMK